MAYPRRLSGTQLAPNPRSRARSSSEEDDSPSLSPPRPFFLSTDTNRSSASSASADNSSLDPPSDSDAEITIPSRAATHQRVHARKRSGMASASSSSGAYAPLDNPSSPLTPSYPTIPTSNPARRSSLTALPPGAAPPAPPAPDTPPLPSPTPTNSSLFKALPSKPPPSSFAFPFQAYPGNPDPGLSIPGLSRRRSSLDSVSMSALSNANYNANPDDNFPRQGSLTDLRKPFAPFMAESGAGTPTSEGGNASSSSLPRSSSSNSLYKQSAAAPIAGAGAGAAGTQGTANANTIPRNASVHSFRAPFLAPSSRPTSSLWSPPSYAHQYASMPLGASPSASTTALPYTPGANGNGTTYPPALALIHKPKPPLPSTRLTAPIHASEKPWLATREPRGRTSYLLTLLCVVLGLVGAAILCFTGITSVNVLDDSRLCSVMDEEFNGGSLDTDGTWNLDVELGGFGNGEFEMTTDSSDNLFLKNGELYIMPTLTSDKVDNVLDGGKYTLDGCTTDNKTACSATSDASQGTVINPVQSARINTKGKKAIKFGKVEVRAKLPKGDWLWPAIWMLPTSETYGAWPISGEIDILEARGNGPAYPAQGSNFIRASLNYGPFPALLHTIFGWFSLKRGDFAKEWHVYTLEWTEAFMRFSVDKTTHTLLEISTRASSPSFSLSNNPPSDPKHSYWNKAGFPQTARNGSEGAVVAVTNPYEGVDGATPAAPYDQEFYLIVDLAAGGTSGWFPDGKGGKMWLDGSLTAMRDFARAQDTWAATWPASQEDRAFRIDYIKMWEVCR